MSNLDARPQETPCRSAEGDVGTEVLEPRDVPLGGIRGMTVSRMLPQRARPTVGAWCFLDRFGPQRADMLVLPHPHTGLQTVTWPLRGEIRHRDSVGSDVVLRPGQLNLMTAGRGVAHSEVSVGDAPLLDALQLWVALPAGDAEVHPAFEQHVELPRYASRGIEATVIMGELGGVVSPATTYTALLGAEIAVAVEAQVPVRRDFEHALLVLDGEVNGVGAGRMLYLGLGRAQLVLSAPGGARAILLGGEPFTDDLVMWWNFVGRSHAEIETARTDWERGERFGPVAGHGSDRIPAPVLPAVHLTPRKRPHDR